MSNFSKFRRLSNRFNAYFLAQPLSLSTLHVFSGSADSIGTSLFSSIPQFREYTSEDWDGSEEQDQQSLTPWVRTLSSGVDLLRNPKYNKGLAFTDAERDRHYLQGLLPPAYNSQDMQCERVLKNLEVYSSDIQKYIHLMALQERNERLFYRVLIDYVEELMPIVYTPTVGQVCEKYGLMFRRPRGLFVSIRHHKGRVMELLKNWPERRVRAIVVTDGERVLGLGDLGVQGMGIPVGKLTLYTVCGGIHPAECLPVTIDVGTNNETLLKDPFYPGLKQRRVEGEDYDELIDEFMEAAKSRYGNEVLIQFEDFANHNAFRLLFQYRGSHLVFNDDIQGTASVALAGIIASLPLCGGTLSSHTYLFNGAGEAGTGIAELLATAISKQAKIGLEEARQKIWLVDSKGLVSRDRSEVLQPHKLPFAHISPLHSSPCTTLISAIQTVRPSVLIGVSGQPKTFTPDVLSTMAEINHRPVIFALSNPTSKSECTAQEAYTATQGRCIFASGSPFDSVEYNGITYSPGQGNNAYIFPGVALGCIISGATRIRDEMFLAAAEALASQVTDQDRQRGAVYPSLKKIRLVSAHIAKAVANKAYEFGLATKLPKPHDLLGVAESSMYNPLYRKLR